MDDGRSQTTPSDCLLATRYGLAEPPCCDALARHPNATQGREPQAATHRIRRPTARTTISRRWDRACDRRRSAGAPDPRQCAATTPSAQTVSGVIRVVSAPVAPGHDSCGVARHHDAFRFMHNVAAPRRNPRRR